MPSNENDQENNAPSFKVSDRRMFTPEGELIESDTEAAAAQKASRSPDVSSDPGVSEELPKEGRETPGARRPGPADEKKRSIDFSSFILSLATSAMAYLGEVPDPVSGQSVENLEGAQQMIDILTILQEKTAGNLEADEARLLDDILYELRMKYLSRAKVIQL